MGLFLLDESFDVLVVKYCSVGDPWWY